MIKIFIVIFLLLPISIEENAFVDESFFKYMTSKTDYNLIANKKNFQDYSISECKTIGFWHLIRYSANYPNFEEISEMNEFLPKLRDTIILLNQSILNESELKFLNKWTPRVSPEMENLLTDYGSETIKSLGLRTWVRLKYLIFNTRISKQVKIRSTNFTRTIESAQKYVEGFFHFWPLKINIESSDIENDYLIKYPDLCEKYLTYINSNQNACSELLYFDFMSSKLRNSKRRFQDRLGVNSFYTNINIAFEMAFKMCQYEYLIDKTISIWCKFFDLETIKLLEYKDDLKNNCKYGYKYEISRLMTCDLVKNLLESLKTFKRSYETNDDTLNKFTAYFTHSSTLMSFLSSMGIGKSEDNFDYENILSENINREFKTSSINPTSSNIGFLLFKCDENSKKPNYLLRVFHNERLVKIDGCQSTDCNLNEFLNYLTFFTSTCKSTKESCKI
ncbi:unnamed protein product [Brachionus calyciflorus]|uniref:Multiple inositol polyphosphate phosphatase 1 n=1 Tax=Brachionus calyciflorus TaxID=104777 RepID=A0A813MVC0_9BILA|nr:unnamed protein product [Brachionus calyciflorus]